MRNGMYYVLDGQLNVVPAKSIEEVYAIFKSKDRIVDQTEIGDSQVSTVFLCLDHGYETEKPLVFETMVFGGPLDGKQERCYTYKEAQQQHLDMMIKVEEAQHGSL